MPLYLTYIDGKQLGGMREHVNNEEAIAKVTKEFGIHDKISIYKVESVYLQAMTPYPECPTCKDLPNYGICYSGTVDGNRQYRCDVCGKKVNLKSEFV